MEPEQSIEQSIEQWLLEARKRLAHSLVADFTRLLAEDGRILTPEQQATLVTHFQAMCSGAKLPPATAMAHHTSTILRAWDAGNPLPPLPDPAKMADMDPLGQALERMAELWEEQETESGVGLSAEGFLGAYLSPSNAERELSELKQRRKQGDTSLKERIEEVERYRDSLKDDPYTEEDISFLAELLKDRKAKRSPAAPKGTAVKAVSSPMKKQGTSKKTTPTKAKQALNIDSLSLSLKRMNPNNAPRPTIEELMGSLQQQRLQE